MGNTTHCAKVKKKKLKFPLTTPWRLTGVWRYNSTHSLTRH